MVLDPFAGSGQTIRVAGELGRSACGFELDKKNWLHAQAFIAGELDETTLAPSTKEGE